MTVEQQQELAMLVENAREEHELVRMHAGDIRDLYERDERVMRTLSVIALTLADFRDRLETLERSSRWSRFKDWVRALLFDNAPIFRP